MEGEARREEAAEEGGREEAEDVEGDQEAVSLELEKVHVREVVPSSPSPVKPPVMAPLLMGSRRGHIGPVLECPKKGGV